MKGCRSCFNYIILALFVFACVLAVSLVVPSARTLLGIPESSEQAAFIQAAAAIVALVVAVVIPAKMRKEEEQEKRKENQAKEAKQKEKIRSQEVQEKENITLLTRKVFKDFDTMFHAFTTLNTAAKSGREQGATKEPWERDFLATRNLDGEFLPFNHLGAWPDLYTSLRVARDKYGSRSQYFLLLAKLCEISLIMAEAYQQLEFQKREVKEGSSEIFIHGTFRLWIAFGRVQESLLEIEKEFEKIFGYEFSKINS